MASLVTSLPTVLPDVERLSAPLVAMASGGGVNVDFDATFLVQMVVFAALIVILEPLLVRPMLKLFEERERRTDGARADARAMQERAGDLLQEYERELDRVGRVAAEERDKIRAEATRLEAEILGEARAGAAKIVEEGRRQIEEEGHAIRFDLGREAERLGRTMAGQLLGRELH